MAASASVRGPKSFLRHTVAVVVSRRSQKQVVGINTRPVVALMTDIQTVRDWPFVEAVRNPMSLLVANSVPDRPVACRHSAHPEPAPTIWLRGVKLFENLFCDGARLSASHGVICALFMGLILSSCSHSVTSIGGVCAMLPEPSWSSRDTEETQRFMELYAVRWERMGCAKG